MKKELLNKIKEAEYVCHECGCKYGEAPTGDIIYTAHEDNCDICGENKSLAHIRLYRYLYKTLKK